MNFSISNQQSSVYNNISRHTSVLSPLTSPLTSHHYFADRNIWTADFEAEIQITQQLSVCQSEFPAVTRDVYLLFVEFSLFKPFLQRTLRKQTSSGNWKSGDSWWSPRVLICISCLVSGYDFIMWSSWQWNMKQH